MPEIPSKNTFGDTMSQESASECDPISLKHQLKRGPGILTVSIQYASRLSLPDDSGWPCSETNFSKRTFADQEVRERWLPYAVVEYEGYQISTDATGVYGDKGVIAFAAMHRPLKFEVSASASCELTVSLFARDKNQDMSKSYEHAPRRIPLGLIRLDPLLASQRTDRHGISVQNGTGNVQLQVSYIQTAVAPLKTKGVWKVRDDSSCDPEMLLVQKKDTGRTYAVTTIDSRTINSLAISGSDSGTDLASHLQLQSAIQHPFIAPLQFAFRSTDETLRLLSPLASGGYLFHHLQREKRFHANAVRLYAAELVCALEHLRDKQVIFASLKADNILLDSSGHVSLCSPGLFGLSLAEINERGGYHITPGKPEYPAPEALSARTASSALDWWALGIIVYEMLIGIPPFYHKDANQRRHKIINEDLHLPDSLQPAARDLLGKLLDKNPTRRLGANGPADVKAHPFFHDVEWAECLRRTYTTPFKPQDAVTVFWRDPGTYQPFQLPEDREYRESEGTIYERRGTDCFPFWREIGRARDKPSDKKSSIDIEDDNGWDLVWEPVAEEFHFENRLTGKRAAAQLEPADSGRIASSSVGGRPSGRQKKNALAAALKAGYSTRVFSQILEYGVNLNASILGYDQTPDELDIVPAIPDEVRVTPLEWVVEHDRLDLIHLFLDSGADVNFTIAPRQGPALLKAVRKNRRQMVEILLPGTNRVSCTRALALAVEQQNTALVQVLLEHGVCCDFEQSDRAPGHDPFHCDYDSYVGVPPDLEAYHFTPPLVRAARLGNVCLVQLLLAHGANANAVYHDLGGRGRPLSQYEYETDDCKIPVNFSCGRVVQIAMELGHSEIVHLLLDTGADIHLKLPAWPLPSWGVPDHICQPVPRAAWVEVMASLNAAVGRA